MCTSGGLAKLFDVVIGRTRGRYHAVTAGFLCLYGLISLPLPADAYRYAYSLRRRIYRCPSCSNRPM